MSDRLYTTPSRSVTCCCSPIHPNRGNYTRRYHTHQIKRWKDITTAQCINAWTRSAFREGERFVGNKAESGAAEGEWNGKERRRNGFYG
jgi:hypothetical protein